jgi:penicillin-binding protein 2
MMVERAARLRFACFRVVIILAFCIVAVKLWGLQVSSSEEYQLSADRNRFRLVPVDAPRGIVYDRFGRILVRNVASFAVSIVPAGLPDDTAAREAVLQRVGELLNTPVDDSSDTGEPAAPDSASALPSSVRGPEGPSLEALLRERTVSPYSAVRIASNVDRQAAFIIEEEHLDLPGVLVEVEPLRQYVDGPLTSHVLGYVGWIPGDRLGDYVGEGYQPDDLVGLTGIELTQEHFLRGVKGQKHIEVDAFEREVSIIAYEAATQGHNVILTIDLELQQASENALREGMRRSGSEAGVVVAMDPRSGEVLAMVSLPSYDNNLFSGGISYDDYVRLSSDRHRPLVNHTISGQYPPGSAFKIVPACGALEDGVIDRRTALACKGTLLLPNKNYPDDLTKAQEFRCWNEHGHGALDVVGAIQQSCDIYFYIAAGGYGDLQGLGMERLAEYARMFGFGQPTDIELSGEARGLVPNDRWKRQNYGENWVTGDTYNATIGQGYVLATPLQVLNAMVAVANWGTLYRPQLVYQVTDADGRVVHALTPEPIRDLEISEENLSFVRRGMREAVTNGTAWLLRLPAIAVAGKTGTAEYPGVDEDGNLMLDEEGNLPTHAWFAAFAPYEDPEIALVVFLDGGGEGSQTAVPVAADILRHYFDLPEPTPEPTATPTG